MNEIGICDYSDYDYKKDFWNNTNRKYEHQLEINIFFTIRYNTIGKSSFSAETLSPRCPAWKA